jgi:hypothetical protein
MPRSLGGLLAAVGPVVPRPAAYAAGEDGSYDNYVVLSCEGGN